MNYQNKMTTQNRATRTILVAIAIITCLWLLATVKQPTANPYHTCQVQGVMNGQITTFNQC